MSEKEFEQLLDEFNFVRIHQSHLVNLAYIKKYNKGDGESIILTDGNSSGSFAKTKRKIVT
ncbi:MAG: LytTR family transcriptional regulator [Ignavibacteria bacterium]|nr:LytTR family transcriptional regulator [Ignavibacteria bacterium]